MLHMCCGCAGNTTFQREGAQAWIADVAAVAAMGLLVVSEG
jgi:hypothetical protein